MCNTATMMINNNNHMNKNHRRKMNMQKPSHELCAWRVNNYDLVPFPSTWTLAPSHITVHNSTAPVISGRISEFARLYSLATQKNSDTPYTLRCTTNTSLVIEINLWKQQQSDDRNDAITVEISKRKGDAFEYRRLKCLLLRAILNGNKHTAQEIKSTAPKHRVVNRTPDMKELKSVMHTALMACDLVSSNPQRTQEILTGLQMLIALTNPARTNRIFANGVSIMILTGAAISGKSTNVKETLYSYVLSHDNDIVHQSALTLIANILERFGQMKKNTLQLESVLNLWGNVIPTLVKDMQNVNQSPHTACVAVRCLRALHKINKNIPMKMQVQCFLENTHNIRSAITEVWKYGRRQHVALEIEVRKLTAAMNPSLAAQAL